MPPGAGIGDFVGNSVLVKMGVSDRTAGSCGFHFKYQPKGEPPHGFVVFEVGPSCLQSKPQTKGPQQKHAHLEKLASESPRYLVDLLVQRVEHGKTTLTQVPLGYVLK